MLSFLESFFETHLTTGTATLNDNILWMWHRFLMLALPQVAQLVPESELYSNMLAVDRQVTSAINYKKARVREALQRPLRVPKRLRVVISSQPEHQTPPRFTPGAPSADDILRGVLDRMKNNSLAQA